MIDEQVVTSEKTVLIGIISQHQDEIQSKEYLDELQFLTETAGGVPVKRFVQKLEKPHPKTFLGTGKLEEVKAYIDSHDIGTAIFDDELSPAQMRNIEKVLDCKISRLLTKTSTSPVGILLFLDSLSITVPVT